MTFAHLVRAPFLRHALVLGVFEAAYILAYLAGMSFGRTAVPPLWFPHAVLVCALLVKPPRWWGVLLLATLPVWLYVAVAPGPPAWVLLSTYVIDCGTAVLSAVLLRSLLKVPTKFDDVKDFAHYCIAAVIFAPIVGAVAGAAVRSVLGDDYWTAWNQWFFGYAMAALVVTPVFFYWGPLSPGAHSTNRTSTVEAALLACGLVVTAWWAFKPGTAPLPFDDPRFFGPVPLMFWAAVRFGMVGATGAVATVTCFAAAAAAGGLGPFAGQSPERAAIGLQHFLLLRAAPLYFVALLAEQSRRIGQRLGESERRFHELANSAPVLIRTYDRDMLCDYCNKGWMDFTGRTLAQERDHRWTENVHPHDLDLCLGTYRSGFDAQRPFELDYRLRRHDGEYRWVLDKVVPRYGDGGEFIGCIASAVDVTDRRAQECALRESEERYRDVVDCQTDLICRFRPDTTLTFVNEAYCRYFGRRRDEVLGASLLDSLPEDARPSMRHYIARLSLQREADDLALEQQLTLPNGSVRWLRWVARPTTGTDSGLRGFQAIGHDTTDRKRAEAADHTLKFASRLAAIGELTAIVAHEIRQPLSAILSNAEAAELLLQRKDPPLDEIRQILADICRDDLRADEVIRSVRALLTRREMQPEPFNLNDAVIDVLRLTASDAAQRGIRLHHDLQADLPSVSADRVHIGQVLLNLFINGMEAMVDTPEPDREIAVRTTWDGAGSVEVAVSDRGHGVRAEILPLLFESFYTTKSGGMGLGLSIARSVIQTHQGRIWAENNRDGGAVFRFILPALAAPRPQGASDNLES